MENGVNRKIELPPHALLLCAGLIFALVAMTNNVCAQQTPQPTTQTPVAATPQNSTTPPAASSVSSAASASQAEPDLAITANVTARELLFEQVPNPRVDFTGHPERETVWDAARQNLPRPVQPGVTYRNIGIQLKITSRFADIDRIVAEALGEVPAATNDHTPEENSLLTPIAHASSPAQSSPPQFLAPSHAPHNTAHAAKESANRNGGTPR